VSFIRPGTYSELVSGIRTFLSVQRQGERERSAECLEEVRRVEGEVGTFVGGLDGVERVYAPSEFGLGLLEVTEGLRQVLELLRDGEEGREGGRQPSAVKGSRGTKMRDCAPVPVES